MIKVAVLDDYQNIFKEIIDTESHKTKIEFKVFNHKFENQEDLIQELDSFEALFLMRERTQINSEIINSLPKLKYIMTSGMRNNSIDLQAAKNKNIFVQFLCLLQSKSSTFPQFLRFDSSHKNEKTLDFLRFFHFFEKRSILQLTGISKNHKK